MEENTEDDRAIGPHKNTIKLRWCLMHAVESFTEAENIRWNAAVQQAMGILITMIDMKPTTEDLEFVLKKMALVESTKEQRPQPHPQPDEVLSSAHVHPCQQLVKRPPDVEKPTKRLLRHEAEHLYITNFSEFRLLEEKMHFEGRNHTSDPKEIALIRACTFSISLLDYFPLQGELDEAAIDRISTKLLGSVGSTGQAQASEGKEWITELNKQSEKQFAKNTSLYLLNSLNGVPSAIARSSSGQIEAVAVFFQASQASFAKNVARFFSHMFSLSSAWVVLDCGNVLSYEFVQLNDKALQNIEKKKQFYVNFIDRLAFRKPN